MGPRVLLHSTDGMLIHHKVIVDPRHPLKIVGFEKVSYIGNPSIWTHWKSWSWDGGRGKGVQKKELEFSRGMGGWNQTIFQVLTILVRTTGKKNNKSGWLKLFYRPPVWLLKWCSANQFFNINENMCPYLPKRYLESISVINFLHQWYQHLKKAFDHCYRVASFIAKFYRHKFHSILGKLKVLGKQFFSKVTTPVNS